MITRLKVQGFKNLYDVELYFGPLTCIAGTNGVGKSNLFDALKFLGELANKTLLEAALSIRNPDNEKRSKSLDIRNIFFNDGQKYCDQMSFEVDLILPENAVDDLGQKAEATTTFVTYSLSIGYNEINKNILEIKSEQLKQLNQTDYKKILSKMGFSKEWIKSVSGGVRRSASAFIETHDDKVSISQDQQKGRNKSLQIQTLPRTILSTANAIETPTALVCKREIESWRFLQLEPSALRSADDMAEANQRIQANGAHLPATLYRLHSQNEKVQTAIANRLSELIDDVFEINVDKDEKRDILTLMLKGKDSNFLPASSLSDGTLRFLALSIIESDPSEQGLICLEEPENGIHPARIPAMLRLLKDIATDADLPTGNDNPLRQVIINTHSPLVVSEVEEGELLVAEPITYQEDGRRFEGVTFKPLSGTWRHSEQFYSGRPTTKATLLNYLYPLGGVEEDAAEQPPTQVPNKRKVRQRPEITGQLPIFQNPIV
ncbi:MAG: AAA family ATPase [Spirosomaceae bacterium]|jgi:predicted ATPase|nr:AAA family ATPase [Spirosomataceae bacterium]